MPDLSRDRLTPRAKFERYICNNYVTRSAHHHVFDTRLAMDMLDSAGSHLLGLETAMPFHSFLLAGKADHATPIDNGPFHDSAAVVYRRSPFASDLRPSA